MEAEVSWKLVSNFDSRLTRFKIPSSNTSVSYRSIKFLLNMIIYGIFEACYE